MNERNAARTAQSKPDGRTFNSNVPTTRPTVDEVRSGDPGTGAFEIYVDPEDKNSEKVRRKSEQPQMEAQIPPDDAEPDWPRRDDEGEKQFA